MPHAISVRSNEPGRDRVDSARTSDRRLLGAPEHGFARGSFHDQPASRAPAPADDHRRADDHRHNADDVSEPHVVAIRDIGEPPEQSITTQQRSEPQVPSQRRRPERGEHDDERRARKDQAHREQVAADIPSCHQTHGRHRDRTDHEDAAVEARVIDLRWPVGGRHRRSMPPRISPVRDPRGPCSSKSSKSAKSQQPPAPPHEARDARPAPRRTNFAPARPHRLKSATKSLAHDLLLRATRPPASPLLTEPLSCPSPSS